MTTHDENGVRNPPAKPLQMVILFDESSGKFAVHGIPTNHITALGMLKMAEHIVLSKQRVTEPQSPIMLVPPGTTLPKQ